MLFFLLLLSITLILGSCRSESHRYETSKAHKSAEKKMAAVNEQWSVMMDMMVEIQRDESMDPQALEKLAAVQLQISTDLLDLERLEQEWEVDMQRVPKHQLLLNVVESYRDLTNRLSRCLAIEQIILDAETQLDKNNDALMAILVEGTSVSDPFKQDLETFSAAHSDVLKTLDGSQMPARLEEEKLQTQSYQMALTQLQSLETKTKADENIKEILISTLKCIIQMCEELKPYREDLIRMADSITFLEYIEEEKNELDTDYLGWLTDN